MAAGQLRRLSPGAEILAQACSPISGLSDGSFSASRVIRRRLVTSSKTRSTAITEEDVLERRCCVTSIQTSAGTFGDTNIHPESWSQTRPPKLPLLKTRKTKGHPG